MMGWRIAIILDIDIKIGYLNVVTIVTSHLFFLSIFFAIKTIRNCFVRVYIKLVILTLGFFSYLL